MPPISYNRAVSELPPSQRPGKARRAAVTLAVGLAALTAAAFAPVLGNGFITYDDNEYVTDNLRVLDGLSLDNLRWALTTFDNFNWHPLTWLSHMADVELFGPRPWGHHLTSLLLHACSTVLLFLVLRGMTGAAGRSALVAALFAVHPLHVQSVAWVAERKDVLSGLFWFLAIGAYLRYVRAPSPWRSVPVAVLFAFGLAAKAMVVTLPAVLLLLDYWPLGRIGRRDWARDLRPRCAEKAPLLLLAAAGGALVFAAQHRGEAVASFKAFPLDTRLWNAFHSYIRYLAKALAPLQLSVFYPHPGRELSAATGVASFLALAAITALIFRASRRRGYLLTGWLWYLVTLLPVIGLIQVGPQAMADRYTYLPLVGLFILFAWSGAEAGSGRIRTPVLATAATAGVLVLAGLTWRETLFWRDSLTLAEHSAAATGYNSVLLSIKGTFLSRTGRFEEAIPVLQEAVALEPGGPYNQYNLASTLARAGRAEEAVRHYRLSLENSPGDAEAHLALGVLLAELGRTPEAFEHLRTSARLAPDHHVAHRELSRALEKIGLVEEAREHARRAVVLAPGEPRNQMRLGLLLAGQGKLDEALAAFQQAAELDPSRADAWYNIGRVHDLRGDRVRAAEFYRRSLTLEPASAQGHVSLGAVLMELGRAREAEAHFLEALQLEPGNREAQVNLLHARSAVPPLDKPGAGKPLIQQENR